MLLFYQTNIGFDKEILRVFVSHKDNILVNQTSQTVTTYHNITYGELLDEPFTRRQERTTSK